MKENSQGRVKKWMAFTCHYCPLCRYGRKNPGSFIGKLLHHKTHADNCPFWKAAEEEEEVYGHG